MYMIDLIAFDLIECAASRIYVLGSLEEWHNPQDRLQRKKLYANLVRLYVGVCRQATIAITPRFSGTQRVRPELAIRQLV